MCSKDRKNSWTLVKHLSFKEHGLYGVKWGISLPFVDFAGKRMKRVICGR